MSTSGGLHVSRAAISSQVGERRRDGRWFVHTVMPLWMQTVKHPEGGVYDSLDESGAPAGTTRSTLVTARALFTFAHLFAQTGSPAFLGEAEKNFAVLDSTLRDPDGGYRFDEGDGAGAARRRSYDQSFALLGLATFRGNSPDLVPAERLTNCWEFAARCLRDPLTGALFDDDVIANGVCDGSVARSKVRFAQNPVMHFLEAVLQTFEVTRDEVWLQRACGLAHVGLSVFVDPATGAVCEFVGEGASAAELQRREPGHQFEWAWLLRRLSELSGDNRWEAPARRMASFAETYGMRRDGPMQGTLFDAVDAAGSVSEDTHLLWPLTEAGKYYASIGDASTARSFEDLIFERFFSTDNANGFWVNQLDRHGRPVWPVALSRLVYHVALFASEGARAGLFSFDERFGAMQDNINNQEEKP